MRCKKNKNFPFLLAEWEVHSSQALRGAEAPARRWEAGGLTRAAHRGPRAAVGFREPEDAAPSPPGRSPSSRPRHALPPGTPSPQPGQSPVVHPGAPSPGCSSRTGSGYSLQRLSFCPFARFTSLPHLEHAPLPPPQAHRRARPPRPRSSPGAARVIPGPPCEARTWCAVPRAASWGRGFLPRRGVSARIRELRSPLARALPPPPVGSWRRSRGCARGRWVEEPLQRWGRRLGAVTCCG